MHTGDLSDLTGVPDVRVAQCQVLMGKVLLNLHVQFKTPEEHTCHFVQ